MSTTSVSRVRSRRTRVTKTRGKAMDIKPADEPAKDGEGGNSTVGADAKAGE